MADYKKLCSELLYAVQSYLLFTDVDKTTADQRARRVDDAMNAARTALAEPEHRMGPTDDELLSLDQLREAWNAQADAMNSWDELGIDEIIWWAQRQALARWGTSSRSN